MILKWSVSKVYNNECVLRFFIMINWFTILHNDLLNVHVEPTLSQSLDKSVMQFET